MSKYRLFLKETRYGGDQINTQIDRRSDSGCIKRRWITCVLPPSCRTHRCEARERDGSMVAKGRSIYNGQINAHGQMYVVRDEYFEPAFGHLAEKGLAALKNKSKLGRPTLLETHRSNFDNSLKFF